MRAKRAEANKTPKDNGEELPPFMIPPRYKLILKFLQSHRNSTRLHRKPIPSEVKSDFAEKAKHYGMYVHAQKLLLEQEETNLIRQQENTDIACSFLPIYL